MPNSQSKAAVNNESKSKWVYLHMWANITGICVLLQARDAMSRNLRGNASEVARIMSYMSAGVGALELLLNPMAGQLSDKYGRRNFLLLSPPSTSSTSFTSRSTHRWPLWPGSV